MAAAGADAQTVTLRYRWTKGDTVTYRMVLQTTSLVTGVHGMNEMRIDQGLTQVIKVTAVDVAPDGTATLRETFEALKLEVDGPGGRVSYDTAVPGSANPKIQPLRQTLEAIAGGTITIEQAPDGSIRRVEGAAKILEQITKNTQHDPAAAAAAQGLKAAFSDEALKSSLEQSFPKLPADPVKPGDVWHSRTAMGNEMMGRIVGDVTFTLKAIEIAGPAQIGVALVLTQDIAPPPGPNGRTMRLGDARGAGEIVFDVAKGRIRESTMKAPDGTTANMDNRTTTTVRMQLIEKQEVR